jgi:MFS family permease
MKLSESPVFRAMQEEGEIAGNPFVESFTYPGNKKRIFIALFGVAAGLTVIWYTSMFYALSFLKGAMRVEDTTAEIIVGIGALIGTASFVIFGSLSDKIGRKLPIIWGYVVALLALFPVFWVIGEHANPGLAATAARAPVVVVGADCSYNPFLGEQKTNCGKLLSDLSGTGIPYTHSGGDGLSLTVGGEPVPLDSYAWGDKAARAKQLQATLQQAGYDLDKVTPSLGDAAVIVAALVFLMAISGATYGPVAALLSEMFPPRIRYSSMSIPYHIGTGYFGGFLPLIAGLIVVVSGDPYAGLWYTWVIVAVALLVAAWGLAPGLPRDFSDDKTA